MLCDDLGGSMDNKQGPGLQVTEQLLADLKPWRGNPRSNDSAAARLAEAIREFGWTTPILVDLDNRIIAGHTRAKAAAILQLVSVPTIQIPVRGREAERIALADNKLAEIAQWDQRGLAAVVETLQGEGLDLGVAGFDPADLDEILGGDPLGLQAAVEPIAEPAPDVTRSARGEVYRLGPHTLTCGDSTDQSVWEGFEVDMLLTDPPYCSGGTQEAGRSVGSVGCRSVLESKQIERDNLTTDGLVALLGQVVRAVAASGVAYVFTDWRQLQSVRRTVEPLGYSYRGLVVWDKGGGGLGWPFMHTYEFIYCGARAWKKNKPGDKCVITGRNAGGGGLSDLISVPRSGNKHHTTEKPVDLLRRLIDKTPGDVIADPFAGSGSTLIAAAQCGRVAVLCEYDPKYCDVIRRRWYDFATAAGIDPGPDALPPSNG